jgi:hypothetical protein
MAKGYLLLTQLLEYTDHKEIFSSLFYNAFYHIGYGGSSSVSIV